MSLGGGDACRRDTGGKRVNNVHTARGRANIPPHLKIPPTGGRTCWGPHLSHAGSPPTSVCCAPSAAGPPATAPYGSTVWTGCLRRAASRAHASVCRWAMSRAASQRSTGAGPEGVVELGVAAEGEARRAAGGPGALGAAAGAEVAEALEGLSGVPRREEAGVADTARSEIGEAGYASGVKRGERRGEQIGTQRLPVPRSIQFPQATPLFSSPVTRLLPPLRRTDQA